MRAAPDILDLMAELRARGEPFALATVIRTVAATAAKAGAKAVIRDDGTVSGGWIGGGCARAAVLRAARDCLADGQPRLVSVQPEDVLAGSGLAAGAERDGVRFARNRCPSRGTMDVFVEPMLPRPAIVIFGASPVAMALADLGQTLGYRIVACAAPEEEVGIGHADERIAPAALAADTRRQRWVVVATQGRGDEAALRAALAAEADYLAFVGSRAKARALTAALLAEGWPAAALERIKAPAGLDLGAITPEEIALSILAEITQARRRRAPRQPAPPA